MAIFTKKKLIGFLMDLVLWTIVAMKKLPDTEKKVTGRKKRFYQSFLLLDPSSSVLPVFHSPSH